MDRVNKRCAGIDVHRDSLMVCMRIEQRESVSNYGTTSREILKLSDDLAAAGVTIVAMEATGVYWKPLWNLLEGRFQLMLVNAQHVKRVPGRKTDVSDAQWLADLLEHGLLSASFVPELSQRELRDLTRQRTQLLNDRARVLNRVHKVLESANLKIGSVMSDIGGASGRKVLHALAEGRLSIEQMVQLVDPRMEDKKPRLREALVGKVGDHQRFMLHQLLDQIQHLDVQVECFDRRIQEVMSPLERQMVEKLDEVPGFDQRSGENVIAEIGTDMNRFPTSGHLASWAGICPGNHQSGGKRKSGKIRKANKWLKAALTQAAWGAGRTKRSYFSEQHRRLTIRRGVKRASIAVAHSLLIVSYYLLKTRELEYTDLGSGYFTRAATPEKEVNHLVKRLQRLGYQVDLHHAA